MIDFLNIIKINAQYEIKILLRSWFFRIFAVTSILFLTGFDVLFYSSVTPVPRFFRGLDSFLPYFNILTPHFVLVIVLAFLATDLYKRDLKFNTTDIIYIRDMSNLAFIMGRTLGVLILFFILDVIFLFVIAIINIFFSDHNFIWQAYLIYLVWLALPSSVFVMGFTFFLIHILRNQAVVILLVLGLLAVSIFYLTDYGFLVFDIMAVKLPFAYSDFVGLSNDSLILYQRMGWFLSGLFFLLLSILLAKRLPQSRKATAFILLLVVILPIAIGSLFYSYYHYFNEGQNLRSSVLEQSTFIARQNNPDISKYTINVQHLGEKLELSATIHYRNNSNVPIDTLYFLLNNGLKISKVQQASQNISFQEEGNLRIIKLKNPLRPAKDDSIQIEYSGYLDDRIANSEIKNSDRILTQYIWLFRMDVRHSYVENDYVLLQPALYWYPKNIPSATRDLLKPFVDFSLKVRSKEGLLALSQGRINKAQTGEFIFENDQPLKDISLVIGPYLRQTVKLDSVEFNLFSLAKHDYYKEFFKEIGDTLPAIISEVMEDFENKTALRYPFKRLNFIEVPIHLYSYQQNGRENPDFVQAEQIWIPENAATLSSSYFKFVQERQNRWGNRSNQTITDLEKEIINFKRFAKDTFTGGGGFRVGGDAEIISFVPNLNMYPLFLNLAVSLDQTANNGFAIALESHIKKEAKTERQKPRWLAGELTDAEKANLALMDTSFLAIEQNAKASLVNKVWLAKGSYLLKQIKQSLGEDNFNLFLQKITRNNFFKQTSMSMIINDLSENYNFDLDKHLENWVNENSLPGFQFHSLQNYQIRDGERLRYQVLFNLNNPTTIDGLFEVEFIYPGENRRRFAMVESETSPKWLFKANAGSKQRVGIVLDSEPRSILINTLISQNLPSIYSFIFEEAELKPNKTAIDGIFEIDNETYSEDQAMIVDNSNENFGYIHPRYRSKLKAWIHEDSEKDESEFKRFSWWQGPTQWQKLKFPSLFGEFVHSAYYARSGEGERKATWVTEIPEDGLYQVFVYVPDKGDFRVGRRSNEYFSIQKYTVDHADGQDEIEIDFSQADPGWNYLETYFFKEGKAQIVLDDDSEGRMVIADAVKWELKE